MRKTMKRKQPSPRRPKPKKCAEYRIGDMEANLLMLVMNDKAMLDALCRALEIANGGFSAVMTVANDRMGMEAERDEARKELAGMMGERDAYMRLKLLADEERDEALAELRKLQAFKDLALGLAQRDLAGNLHIKAEDAKNCLQ